MYMAMLTVVLTGSAVLLFETAFDEGPLVVQKVYEVAAGKFHA